MGGKGLSASSPRMVYQVAAIVQGSQTLGEVSLLALRKFAAVNQQPLISIVDDDDGVRLALDGLIRSVGYRVAMFDSAESFLDSPCAAISHCVISDIQMPGGVGGIELTRRIVAGAADTPVILISAFLDDQIENSAHAAGAEVCLKKPFDGEVLIACLEKALQR